MFLWTHSMQFRQSAENLSANVCKFFAQSPKKIMKLEFLQEKIFSSKYSAGHIECNSDNPAKKFSPKFRKFLLQTTNTNTELNFFEKKCSS